jgi:hypothetical protein
MTNNVKNIFKLLISVVNEVERKLAGILIQNHYGDNNITNILLVVIKQDIHNCLTDDIKTMLCRPLPYVIFMGIFLTRYQFTAIYYISVLTAKKMYNMFMQKMTLLKMIKYNHIGMSSFLN